tara:strand:+ start:1232 stop:1666 length:435 start_codon:yes stop_codon:yes gene_type:complete
MKFSIIITLISLFIYSCSSINKQHGYLLDDVLSSSEKMSNFEEKLTTKVDIYSVMGSPSIEISDIENTWIYLISLKEKNVFEADKNIFQSIYRFSFNDKDILIKKEIITQDSFKEIAFSTDETEVERNAYSISDQLYDAFTRGQ